jgi:hypothetical protein
MHALALSMALKGSYTKRRFKCLEKDLKIEPQYSLPLIPKEAPVAYFSIGSLEHHRLHLSAGLDAHEHINIKSKKCRKRFYK